MIATFWDKLGAYADSVRTRNGKNSEKYRAVQEIEQILQEAYDECNQFDKEAINVRPRTETEAFLFEHLPEVHVFEDRDGYYYEIDGHHKDTAAEVLDYVIQERRSKYKRMNAMYLNKYKEACKKMVMELYTDTKDSFMQSLGYKRGDYKLTTSVVIYDTKGNTSEDEK